MTGFFFWLGMAMALVGFVLSVYLQDAAMCVVWAMGFVLSAIADQTSKIEGMVSR